MEFASAADVYAQALSLLNGNEFERAIQARLGIAVYPFKTIPRSPGDGGLDGLSHREERAYFCYGMDLLKAKTKTERKRMLVAKFSGDLRRILEVDEQLAFRENDVLLEVFGEIPPPDRRIRSITMIANWYDDYGVIGGIKKNLARYVKASRRRWVSEEVDFTIVGPRQFADTYGADNLATPLLQHDRYFADLAVRAAAVALPDGDDAGMTFDEKIERVRRASPAEQSAQIDGVKEDLRREWQQAAQLEQDLTTAHPEMHRALEGARRHLDKRVLSIDAKIAAPWDLLANVNDEALALLNPVFSPVYGEAHVRDIAAFETARLIGICRIRWSALSANPN